MTAKRKTYKVGDHVWYRMRGQPMRHGKISKVLVDFTTHKASMYVMSYGDLVKPGEIKGIFP